MAVINLRTKSKRLRASKRRRLNTIVGLGLAGLTLLALGWFASLIYDEVRIMKFVIPPDTKQGIATGKPGVEFPDEIVLTLGLRDTIVIENQDDVVHSFGPFVVGPHATLTKRFDVPITYEGACTFHQEQYMRLVVNPAPWDQPG
jgi:hypothetical protein